MGRATYGKGTVIQSLKLRRKDQHGRDRDALVTLLLLTERNVEHMTINVNDYFPIF